jgi:DNA gyrase subunit A
MYKMGLMTGELRKSAKVVGATMELHPHGDLAIYETLVRLTRGNDALLHPFIESKGNFGKAYSRDMAYAAARYTEVKLDAVCALIFKDIDKDTVDFADSYDGTLKEPLLLPASFPNLLVTPNKGIAVGMESSVPGFNLKEICLAAAAYIKDNDVDLMKVITAPDFSTGGELIYDEDALRQIYETGRGGFKVRARYRYDKKNSCVEVFEIPYSTTVEAIIDKIAALIKSGKIKEITDVRDETDKDGLKLTLDIRRSADPEQLMKRLFAMTPLMDNFNCNFNFLVDGKPRTMGIRETICEWLRFRVNCLRRRTRFDLLALGKKKNLLEGLSKILLDIDKAIKIIRQTENDKDVLPNLMAAFKIDAAQAEYVAEIRLRNLNKEYLLNRVNELGRLTEEEAGLRELLGDEQKIMKLIHDELREIAKKYGKPRRTGVVHIFDEPKQTAEIFIEDYPLKFFLTRDSYLKKISHVSLRTSGEQYLKSGDAVIQELDASNKLDVLFFSDKFNVYKMKAHDIPDCKAGVIGEYLVNLLKTDDDERIVFMAVTADYSGYLMVGFQNGKAAKIEMNGYATKMNRKKLVNAYSAKSPAVYFGHIAADCEFAAARGTATQISLTNNILEKITVFDTSLITPVTSKDSQGVQVLTLGKKGSVMARFAPASELICSDLDYYRDKKIPGSGHFVREGDSLG